MIDQAKRDMAVYAAGEFVNQAMSLVNSAKIILAAAGFDNRTEQQVVLKETWSAMVVVRDKLI
jgi:hypothetical protein